MNDIFDQMVSRYQIRTRGEKLVAQREVIQEITLSALHRAGFFERAAFYGGTCLRIFHHLPRSSEDLDFSLMKQDAGFSLEPYFKTIQNEFTSFGREVTITKKARKTSSQVESAFLKDTTEILNVEFQTERTIKIKIEVDKDPPMDFSSEYKLLLLPYSFMNRCFTLPGLFAGKIHALLFRTWRNRVKGRDWYDLEWYVRKDCSADFHQLKARSIQFGYAGKEDFTEEVCIGMLKSRIEATNMASVKADVAPFIRDISELDIWSTDYFLQLADRIKFE